MVIKLPRSRESTPVAVTAFDRGTTSRDGSCHSVDSHTSEDQNWVHSHESNIRMRLPLGREPFTVDGPRRREVKSSQVKSSQVKSSQAFLYWNTVRCLMFHNFIQYVSTAQQYSITPIAIL